MSLYVKSSSFTTPTIQVLVALLPKHPESSISLTHLEHAPKTIIHHPTHKRCQPYPNMHWKKPHTQLIPNTTQPAPAPTQRLSTFLSPCHLPFLLVLRPLLSLGAHERVFQVLQREVGQVNSYVLLEIGLVHETARTLGKRSPSAALR